MLTAGWSCMTALLCRTGGSTTGLSATGAWMKSAAGD